VIVLGVLTDGRADYLAETIDAAARHLPELPKFIVNDSGDSDYAAWLRCNYPGYKVVHHHERRGMSGAVNSVWDTALDMGADYLFHLEDDMVLVDSPPLDEAVSILAAYRHVAQMLFKRQPLSAPEINKNDILGGMHHIDCHDGWVTQQHIFSLNPCLIPRWVLEMGWPAGNEAEMTQNLLRIGAQFGVWGDPGSPPLVQHIGESRAVGWRL
jgi:hypothetical protein